EDFIAWGETDPRSYYNGSMMLMTAGARPQVWTQFNAATSPRMAFKAGRFGSDQGWISYCLGKVEPIWTTKDGVYSFNIHIRPKTWSAGPPKPIPTDSRHVVVRRSD